MEDAGYYWTLSRYIHLNPCNGRVPLVSDPEDWPHSSYQGYSRRSRRLSWVAYDRLHTFWQAANGRSNAESAYRKYVKEGLLEKEDPLKESLREFVFGSEDFLRRMVAMAEGTNQHRHRSASRRLKTIDIATFLSTTARIHHALPSQLRWR